MPTQNSPLSQILLHEPRVKQSHVEAIEPGSLGISELQPDDRRRQVEKVTNKGVQLGAELNGMWISWKGGEGGILSHAVATVTSNREKQDTYVQIQNFSC